MAIANKCRVITGQVENFTPMPIIGHALESFTAAGVKFKYSDYVTNGGFNKSSFHEGPIKEDLYVRIYYEPDSKGLLRLEVRNREGT